MVNTLSKNVIDVVGDSLFNCLKVVTKQIDGEGNNANPYIGGILGGTLISVFSLPIGVPLILLSTAGGVLDVLLTKDTDIDTDSKEEVKIEDITKEDENLDVIKYDIFKCIGCKNAMKEYPEFLRMQDGGYVYSRPEGIKLSDVIEYSEDICLALGLNKLEVLLADNNRNLYLREFVDKLDKFIPYENIQRDTKNELKCYVGLCLDKGAVKPLEINFTKDNHIMISSCTGMGKSSVIRVIITDLMLNYSPDELEFYLIDMKRTELVLFDGYKHCAIDCITEHVMVVDTLKKLWDELSNRKDKVSAVGLKDMYQYNKVYPNKKIKYTILVIDEMLEVVNSGDPKDIKEAKRLLGLLLSQGRAFGMYFILSTQQPSRKLIEGSIQSNIGQKLSLRVASKTDAEVVFENINVGLEKIENKGRGFYLKGGTPKEVQCYYIGDPKLQNEQEVIRELLKPYKVSEVKSIMDSLEDEDIEGYGVVEEVAQTVDKVKRVKSNAEIREMLYKTKERK